MRGKLVAIIVVVAVAFLHQSMDQLSQIYKYNFNIFMTAFSFSNRLRRIIFGKCRWLRCNSEYICSEHPYYCNWRYCSLDMGHKKPRRRQRRRMPANQYSLVLWRCPCEPSTYIQLYFQYSRPLPVFLHSPLRLGHAGSHNWYDSSIILLIIEMICSLYFFPLFLILTILLPRCFPRLKQGSTEMGGGGSDALLLMCVFFCPSHGKIIQKKKYII